MTDFDFTKEKLDMKIAKDVRRRNKKEEHNRLMNEGHDENSTFIRED